MIKKLIDWIKQVKIEAHIEPLEVDFDLQKMATWRARSLQDAKRKFYQ